MVRRWPRIGRRCNDYVGEGDAIIVPPGSSSNRVILITLGSFAFCSERSGLEACGWPVDGQSQATNACSCCSPILRVGSFSRGWWGSLGRMGGDLLNPPTSLKI